MYVKPLPTRSYFKNGSFTHSAVKYQLFLCKSWTLWLFVHFFYVPSVIFCVSFTCVRCTNTSVPDFQLHVQIDVTLPKFQGKMLKVIFRTFVLLPMCPVHSKMQDAIIRYLKDALIWRDQCMEQINANLFGTKEYKFKDCKWMLNESCKMESRFLCRICVCLRANNTADLNIKWDLRHYVTTSKTLKSCCFSTSVPDTVLSYTWRKAWRYTSVWPVTLWNNNKCRSHSFALLYTP